MDSDEFFMQEAFREAERASMLGEVPVGAVLVQDGNVSINRRLGIRAQVASIVIKESLLTT